MILTFSCLRRGCWIVQGRVSLEFADLRIAWSEVGFWVCLSCILVLFLVAPPWNLSFGFLGLMWLVLVILILWVGF